MSTPQGFAGLPRQGYQSLGAFFMLLGAPGLCLGTALAGWTVLCSIGTRPTTGVVIALESDDRSDGPGFRPVVEYVVGARKHRVTGLVAWNPPIVRVGDSVRVLYEVGRPEVAIVDTILDRWFLPGLFMVTSSVFVALGYVVFRGYSPWKVSE